MARLSYILLAASILSSTTWAESVSPRDHFDLVGRDDGGTIIGPVYTCPDKKPKCSEKFCGGENPNKKGFCKKPLDNRHTEAQKPLGPRYCKCDPKKGFVNSFLFFFLFGFDHPVSRTLSKTPSDDKNGGGVPIIPFPIPPPGFAPPPAGVPHPKKKDSCPTDYTNTDCEDCKAKAGWCTKGDHAGCPCQEHCPKDGDKKQPKCADDNCKGKNGKNDDHKCSIVSLLRYSFPHQPLTVQAGSVQGLRMRVQLPEKEGGPARLRQ